MDGYVGEATLTYISFLWSLADDHVLQVQVEELKLVGEHEHRPDDGTGTKMPSECACEHRVNVDHRSTSETMKQAQQASCIHKDWMPALPAMPAVVHTVFTLASFGLRKQLRRFQEKASTFSKRTRRTIIDRTLTFLSMSGEISISFSSLQKSMTASPRSSWSLHSTKVGVIRLWRSKPVDG